MLKSYTIYFSLFNNFLEKLLYLFLTILSLKISDQFYSLLILFFVLANYFYEFSSLSIPKIFNNYFKTSGHEKLSVLTGANLYISLFLFIILIFFIFLNKNIINQNINLSDNYFIFAFAIFGFSIFLNDLIDKYIFLKLEHHKIYIFDFFSLIFTYMVLLFGLLKFKILTDDKVFIIIFGYAILQLIIKLIKLYLFKSDIVFNVKKIYSTLKINELINLIKLILPILLISLLTLSQFNISRFIILYFEDYSSFAIFFFHFQIIELCSIFFLTIHQISNSKISILIRDNKKKIFSLFKNKLFNIFFCIVPFILLAIFFMMNEIIQILGINIKLDGKLFLLLSVNFCFIYLFFTIYQYMIMINRIKLLIKTIFFILLLNFIASLILTKFYSMYGLAFANLLSNLLLFFTCNYFTNFFIIRRKEFKKLLLLSIRFLIILSLILSYNYFFLFNNVYLILISKILYFMIIFFISEIFVVNNMRVFYMLNNLIKIMHYKSR